MAKEIISPTTMAMMKIPVSFHHEMDTTAYGLYCTAVNHNLSYQRRVYREWGPRRKYFVGPLNRGTRIEMVKVEVPNQR